MIVFLAIFAVILLAGCRLMPAKEFNSDYMSKDSTNIIKGVFVILVFFSHCSQYITLSGPYDEPYNAVRIFLGQMIVAVFLFYSGYGIMESINKKSFNYIKSIPYKRVFKTLINFDIIVTLFLILDYFLKYEFSPKTIALSYIGWQNIGNSNWYILAILILYIITFISYLPLKFSDKKYMHIICAIVLTVLSAIAVYAMFKLGKESYYYNTMFIFPLGVWYSILKPYIDRFIAGKSIVYTFVLMIVTLAFAYTNINVNDKPFLEHNGNVLSLMYTLWSFAFTLIIVVVSMKVKIKSNLFKWLGEHIFSIYMLQRIPMMILKKAGFCENHKYMFVVICFATTLFLSVVFDTLIAKLWNIKKKSK